ncbi:MAG: AmmeMemoRadiSam system radical SAM enzyme [Candidatus Aminicenantes bacterium]|nr:AmmeMemoRadiSam system radical SAM enzyme [Candidatus Aminicenantes bacterium]
MIQKAYLYHKFNDDKVQCDLCSHRCQIFPSKFGFCGVRKNKKGELYTLVYGELIAVHVDPIEKKPLYHFLPGTSAFSIATIGCNFRCEFCQNWQISQASKRQEQVFSKKTFTPKEIVTEAKKSGCQSISYTYTEPTIFFELAYDTAQIAKEQGLANTFVTNGYMTREALEKIHPYLDACNVDLKSFREEFYIKTCQARLQPVLDSIENMKEMGIWVEVTTLIVPEQNDSEEELKDIAEFIAQVDQNIPWHISRFHPDYKTTDSNPTPLETLKKAYSLGKEAGLKYVYFGNVPGESDTTECPNCGKKVLIRKGFWLEDNHVSGSRCGFCNEPISGVFQ